MAIITLTTDLGLKDYYVGALKAEILRNHREAIIVDITHQVDPFDIFQAAFALQNCYQSFPEDTIHIVGLDTGKNPESYYLLVKKDNQYFLGPDNGLFTIVFSGMPDEIHALTISGGKEVTFPTKDVFAKAACHIANGGDISEISEPIEKIMEKNVLQPVISESVIQGNVIYIDSFQNIIVNIDRDLFERVGQGRTFTIYYHKKETIDKISHNYNDVPEGEVACLFGSAGYMEIALNKSAAGNLLGMEIGEQIQVEFS
ncbi:MAG: SAM-dependent chlorinase/fluorinase [Bacteroidetes bacterium]|nr:SAM-dependent chlorinase/fluorinase [Bacteroidota bacterium]